MADGDDLSQYEVKGGDDDLSRYAVGAASPANSATIGAAPSPASRVAHAGINSDFPYVHPIKAAEAAVVPIQNYTQAGRAEHPILSRIGDAASNAEDLGKTVGREVGLLGAGGAGEIAEAPAAARYLDTASIRNLWDTLPQIGSRIATAIGNKRPVVSIQKDYRIPGTPITISRAPTALENQQDLGAFINKGYKSADLPKKLPSSFVMQAERPAEAPIIPRSGAPTPLQEIASRIPPPPTEAPKPFAGTTIAPQTKAGIPRVAGPTPLQETASRLPARIEAAPKPFGGAVTVPEGQPIIPRNGVPTPLQDLASRIPKAPEPTAVRPNASVKTPGIEGGEGRPATWNEQRLWEFATRPGIAPEYKDAAIKQLEVRGLIKPNTPLTK